MLAAGFFLWAAATFATGFAGGFATILVLRLILGLGESALFPAASKLLKEFALMRSGVAGGGDGDPRSQASKAFRVNGARTISTVIQRWMACTVHAAATEFFELNNPPAAPWPVDVDAPHMLRFLGPGQATRDLSALPPLELADIDVVGLQPVTSLHHTNC